MNLNFDIELTSGQRIGYELCHDPKNKAVVLCFSRQAGKSVLAEILAIEKLCESNKFSAYITPTFQLGRKVYKEIVTLLEPSGIIVKANSSTLTIESKFGSTLQFMSAEAYKGIRGFTVSGVLIIDEAAYIPDTLPNGENFWSNVVQPITKARRPLVVLISTPCGKNGFFYDFYLRALSGEDGIASLTRTIYDDDLVSEDFIAEIKRNISPKAFSQEYECRFLDSSLTFFEGFEECFSDMRYKSDKEWIGVDLSGGGDDETILTRINSSNEVMQHKIEGTLDMKYRKIANLIDSSNALAVYLENNGLGAPMINEVRKLVKNKSKLYEWTTTNSSKEEIISNLAVAIANKDIHFSSEDTELFSQFGTFICKVSKSRKLTFAAMDGKHDDRVMSLAIALQCKNDFKYVGRNNVMFAQNAMKILR